MAREKEKTTGFYFKMSPQEWEWVERRMAETKIKNKSQFIRKMCIDGHVINLDLSEVNEIGRLLRITANNVNQLAYKANSGYNVPCDDVAEVNRQLEIIRTDFGKLLNTLTDLTNPQPGKRFMQPMRISDLSHLEEGA
jgi:hypothetical protein